MMRAHSVELNWRNGYHSLRQGHRSSGGEQETSSRVTTSRKEPHAPLNNNNNNGTVNKCPALRLHCYWGAGPDTATNPLTRPRVYPFGNNTNKIDYQSSGDNRWSIGLPFDGTGTAQLRWLGNSSSSSSGSFLTLCGCSCFGGGGWLVFIGKLVT